MGRILAIDYGRKRTGLAVTDILRITANPLLTIETKDLINWLTDYFAHEPVDEVVIGHPTQMNGEESESMNYIRPFMGVFKKQFPDKPVTMYDERFTSVLAHQAMIAGGMKNSGLYHPRRLPRFKIVNRKSSIVKSSISMILPIYLYGQPVLRKEAEEIENTPELKQFIADMYETLTQAEGCGLAAPQVGKPWRLFIVDGAELEEDYPECKGFKKTFINPELIEESEETCTYSEGCLSLPGISENVIRPKTIVLRYLDEDFNEHEEQFTDFQARIILHEYDHLEGHVFTDRISPIRKTFTRNKLLAIAKGKVGARYKYRRN